jgi:hypothetical protein
MIFTMQDSSPTTGNWPHRWRCGECQRLSYAKWRAWGPRSAALALRVAASHFYNRQ